MNAFERLAAKGQAAPKIRPAKNQSVEADLITIGDDEFPNRRVLPEGKYAHLFNRMKPGQCLKCEPKEALALASALRKWLEKHSKTDRFEVRTISNFPKDGRGRVWLLAKQTELRKAA